MATTTKWSNVAVAMQSALAAADTITGITKASPGVVTSASHGLANGDYVFLSVQGMHQLNDRVVRVANVAANTFELEGVDTTLFDTFSSGTAELITFGTSITTAASISSSGGGFDFTEGSQEEYLFRNSSLAASLWPHRRAGDDRWPEGSALLGRSQAAFYPLTPFGGIYSPRVDVFRAGGRPLAPPRRVAVLSVAAQDLRPGRSYNAGAAFDRHVADCHSLLD